MVRLSSFNEENDKIIVIKKKYELDYPGIKNIFNLWEVLDYFLCNNVKLSKQDKSDVIQIISSTGARLPDLLPFVLEDFSAVPLLECLLLTK